jgi:hypothetical protein
MVRDNDVQDTPPAAVECAAYWCVVADYAQMVNGSLHEARGDFYTFASAPDAPHADMVVVTNSSAAARTSYGQEQNIQRLTQKTALFESRRKRSLACKTSFQRDTSVLRRC